MEEALNVIKYIEIIEILAKVRQISFYTEVVELRRLLEVNSIDCKTIKTQEQFFNETVRKLLRYGVI
ncbi:hypothetical protein MUU46_04595 [Scandinavium sp. TWS1a]|uniref:hypothetical protein n=1 Tax=Scandinavium tedordense TaxID=2926521 RepID=UPI002166362D|nr:hypothetical protein [Scandinavium tedordense]MCS2169601.1 hypothetical protein [Scandinavium tedordense]